MKQKIEQLQAILDQGKRILFFTGAGVSTDSGIPDFRSADGLYSGAYAYPPETILSHTFFLKNTAEFYHFYREKMLPGNARPNAVHLFIAEMEKSGRSLGVVTQNIDGLHQKAGSKNVYELHGSVFRNYCTRCHAFYGIDTIKNTDGIPYCSKCGGIIKQPYQKPPSQRHARLWKRPTYWSYWAPVFASIRPPDFYSCFMAKNWS